MNRTKEEIIELDRLMNLYKKKEIEGKCMVIKWYLICLAIGYVSIGFLVIYKEYFK